MINTNMRIRECSVEQRRSRMEEQMQAAIDRLYQDFSLSWDLQFKPTGDDFLLQVQDVESGERFYIDIATPRSANGEGIKDLDDLVLELQLKVLQHKAARSTHKVVISASGSKYDCSKLISHDLTIDHEGFLFIDQHKIVYKDTSCIRAEQIRSYTVLRLVETEEGIQVIDEYDLARPDCVGMLIRCQEKFFKEEACYSLERPILNEEERDRLFAILQTCSSCF